ncbi:MAG: DUF1552 domain-containing protein [Myxococcota bacterium]
MLPSLLPREAAARGGLVQPRFVAITTEHGAIWPENMAPGDGTVSETTNYAGHEIRRGDLSRTVEGDRANLSAVISGASDRLTDALVSKMNVIRGLDVPFYIAHHRGGHLGNFADNNGDGGDGAVAQGSPTPTIDQQMAWSDEFYSDLSTTLERSMIVGASRSSRYTDPQNPGAVQPVAAEESSLALFNRIFQPPEEPEEENPRPPVVDRIMDNYLSLRQSDRRLSARDRVRLDEHVQRIDELQRRLNVAVSCGEIPVPRQDALSIQQTPGYYNDPDANQSYWQLFNDVIVAAFICGTSRIAVMGITDLFMQTMGDWHQEVAHLAHRPDGEAQALLMQSNQRIFEHVVLDLMSKLDIEEADGSTILDNTLLQWTQESGPLTHESVDSFVVTAGGAGGCLRTGQYLDYRNTQSLFNEEAYENTPVRAYTGLLYQQYLGHALQAMGVSPSAYEVEPGGGYPHLFIGEGRDALYPASVQQARGELLPWLEA